MKFEHELIFEAYSNVLLNEGGAAGHMKHPFDLPEVKDGEDLIAKFNEAPVYLDRLGGSLKIDGTNVSIKLVEDENGNRQFALDRGSMATIDVEGVTIDKLEDRFKTKDGSPHGMVKSGEIILSIFNTALPQIGQELRTLGLWNDPSKFINSEFVQQTTNVVEYDKDFLALHGINQFMEKHDRHGNLVRKGAKRKEVINPVSGLKQPEKGTSKAVPYDKDALESLVEKVKPIGLEYGFDIISTIPVKKIKDPDFESVLNQPVEIKVEPQQVETKTLGEWLAAAYNPINKTTKAVNGKTSPAVSKENYFNVFTGDMPVSAIYDADSVLDAINGALMYKATIDLGNEMLRSYSSDYGNASDHEGIVINTDPPFKITGDFITQGMTSKFRQSPEDEQSAPGVNFGNGYQNVNAQSTNYNASSKDPGGTPYTRNPGPGKGVYFQ
tara:strand:- start:3061 stop:4380 length:1320 start_codon:yes stop_codon:yes gene_type:complete